MKKNSQKVTVEFIQPKNRAVFEQRYKELKQTSMERSDVANKVHKTNENCEKKEQSWRINRERYLGNRPLLTAIC